MKSSIFWLAALIAAIWAVELVNSLMGHQLNSYGIMPRTAQGLIGIPLSPFLHGGFGHVLSNTIPMAVLGGLVAIQGRNALLGVTVFIVLVGGFGVWVAGRPAVHVGASGLVFGYFGYLLARGWFDRRLSSILIAILVVALYGGLIFGVLPTLRIVSWEGHLFGLLAGVLAARLWRRKRARS